MTNSPKKKKVLVVDDEVSIRKLLKTALSDKGFEVTEAGTGNEGVVQAISTRPDIIILDLGLPDEDGMSTLKKLREWYRNPILILSVRNLEEVIVNALDSGADDYLTKPFNLNELFARIRLAERHYSTGMSEPKIDLGKVSVDLLARLVKKSGKEVRLTATEYDVLKTMIKYIDRVLTHRQILREIWGPNSSEHIQYLRVYVGHLRQKLEDDPNNPQLIVTEPGIGYRLINPKPKGNL